MANSLIDDMFTENNQFNGNNKEKKRKGGKIVLVFLVLLIVIALVVVMQLMKSSTNKAVVSAKTEFITYLSKNTMTEILNMSTLQSVFETLVNTSSESNTEITITTNIEELEPISDFKANLNTQYDVNNSRGLIDINLNYLDNDLFNMQALITGKKAALKSDEIVTRYVGYKYENIENIISDFQNEDLNMTDSETYNTFESVTDVLKTFDYEYLLGSFTPEFIQSELTKYVQVLNTLEENKFTYKDVTLERNSGNINTVAYVLTLNEQELIGLASKALEELKNDTELISIFLTALQPTGITIDESMVKLFIDQMINNTYEIEADASKIYTFTIYVSDSRVVKTTLDTENTSIDIDYILNNNNNSCSLTILEKEKSNGIKCELNRISNDVSEQFDTIFSVIENNEVINQISLGMLMQGITSETEMTIEMILSYTDTENDFVVNNITEVEFKDIEVEDLTVDNCLFFDELNTEERTIVIDSIEKRALEVLNDKLNQINLINSNTSSSIIEGQTDTEDNETQKKEEAKEKLINAVANEMYIAEQNGEEYTVNNIADLQIEDVQLEISVDNEIATVIIDGYTFTINSAFELSE